MSHIWHAVPLEAQGECSGCDGSGWLVWLESLRRCSVCNMLGAFGRNWRGQKD